MKPQYVFDVCHQRYRGLRSFLSGRIRAVDLERPSGGYQWRPERARALEFVADFENAGRRALWRPQWKGRLRLFDVYFCRDVEYRQAIQAVGVPEGTFDWWTQEVKKTVGGELSRLGLFPPSRYFKPTNSSS